MLATVLGGYMSAGGAGAINHWFDRDIDVRMGRTADRPVASGRVSGRAAVTFGLVLGTLAVLELTVLVNPLAAALSLSGFLGYAVGYTMLLKRRTWQNIVWGGAAGAVPPLVGWAAVEGSLSGLALFMFAIVFFWTPPHFWALSLLMKDEYAKVGVPMLPVVRGEDETRRQILLYSVLLYAVSQLPFSRARLRPSVPVRVAGPERRADRHGGRAAAAQGPALRAAPLPLLARLPGGAVRRYGGRRPALTPTGTHHGSQPCQEERAHRDDRHGGRVLHVRALVRGRCALRLMSEPARQDGVPPAGEEIHLPGPTALPFVLALATTIALVGVTTSWAVVAVGVFVMLLVIVRWIKDTRRDIAELPLHHD